MSNPNNCASCDHKLHPDGGWCYIFRAEPCERCKQHTGLNVRDMSQKSDERLTLVALDSLQRAGLW